MEDKIWYNTQLRPVFWRKWNPWRENEILADSRRRKRWHLSVFSWEISAKKERGRGMLSAADTWKGVADCFFCINRDKFLRFVFYCINNISQSLLQMRGNARHPVVQWHAALCEHDCGVARMRTVHMTVPIITDVTNVATTVETLKYDNIDYQKKIEAISFPTATSIPLNNGFLYFKEQTIFFIAYCANAAMHFQKVWSYSCEIR